MKLVNNIKIVMLHSPYSLAAAMFRHEEIYTVCVHCLLWGAGYWYWFWSGVIQWSARCRSDSGDSWRSEAVFIQGAGGTMLALKNVQLNITEIHQSTRPLWGSTGHWLAVVLLMWCLLVQLVYIFVLDSLQAGKKTQIQSVVSAPSVYRLTGEWLLSFSFVDAIFIMICSYVPSLCYFF